LYRFQKSELCEVAAGDLSCFVLYSSSSLQNDIILLFTQAFSIATYTVHESWKLVLGNDLDRSSDTFFAYHLHAKKNCSIFIWQKIHF